LLSLVDRLRLRVPAQLQRGRQSLAQIQRAIHALGYAPGRQRPHQQVAQDR